MEDFNVIVPSNRLLTLNRTNYLFFFLAIVVYLNSLMLLESVYAQTKVELIVHPEIEIFSFDDPDKPSTIAFIAETDMQSPSFTWIINGPGTLIGDRREPGIFYVPPEKIDAESDQVVITLAVVNEQKEVIALKVWEIDLLSPKVTPPPTPTPSQTPIPLPSKGPMGIQKILLRDDESYIKHPTYYLEPGEEVIIVPKISISPGHTVIFECNAVFGTIEHRARFPHHPAIHYRSPKIPKDHIPTDDTESEILDRGSKDPDSEDSITVILTDRTREPEIIYRVPDKPGSGDIITFTLTNKDTGKEISTEIINITIPNNSQ